LRGDHEAPLVVIGGGLTGCAVAYACAAAGLKPLLLEASRIGQGDSSRSAGLLLPEPGPTFHDVVERHGLRTTRQMFALWRHGARDAAALLKRLGVARGLEPRQLVTVATADALKQLRREYDARVAAGLDAAWLSPAQVRALAGLDAPGGMRAHGAFFLDPVQTTLGLARAAAAKGAVLMERSSVTRVRFDEKGVDLVVDSGASGGRIRAGTVIVATGSATAEFAPLRRHFKRRETYLTLSEPMPAAVRKGLGKPDVLLCTTGAGRRLTGQTRDGRLLVMGAEQGETSARVRPATVVQRTGQLMYETLLMSPSISGLQPEFGWEAGYGETADGLMYVGAHRNYPHHLFALGGSSMSVTGSFVAAGLLSRAVRGTVEKGDDVLGWAR
jgi:glycine/D-amino acid oxidase-like deaminating enzyme